MPRFTVEFFGSVEIEAENEILAEVDAINNHADAHVHVTAVFDEPEEELCCPHHGTTHVCFGIGVEE